jgi:hypothetical protein
MQFSSVTAVRSKSSHAARLIVCERAGRWAAALRRELIDSDTLLQETRTATDCWHALREAPGSFLVVELTAATIEGLLRRIARRERDFPLARLAAVADRSLAGYEWLVREAGAVHFTCSTMRLGPLAGVIRQHLAQSPIPPQSMVESIWASLPWKNASKATSVG